MEDGESQTHNTIKGGEQMAAFTKAELWYQNKDSYTKRLIESEAFE